MESVWDYPRPPRVEPSPAHVVVELDGQVLADTRRSLRVLETSHPPVYYIPAADIRTEKGEVIAGNQRVRYGALASLSVGEQAVPQALRVQSGDLDLDCVDGMPGALGIVERQHRLLAEAAADGVGDLTQLVRRHVVDVEVA